MQWNQRVVAVRVFFPSPPNFGVHSNSADRPEASPSLFLFIYFTFLFLFLIGFKPFLNSEFCSAALFEFSFRVLLLLLNEAAESLFGGLIC